MPALAVERPYRGIEVHENEHGITVVRLHYDADPEKGDGLKTYVQDIKLSLSPWAMSQYTQATNKGLYLQEYEIDASATEGQRVYILHPEATLCQSFPIPKDWTRYFGLDPHPAVPHACLWCAVDPWGDLWAYRELWPSKVAYRYENGILNGKPGACPGEDNRFRVRQYVDTIAWLESKANPENCGKDGKAFDETITKRVIDYAARAFGKGTSDDPEQLNYQQRFELEAQNHEQDTRDEFYLSFEDAKKNRNAGEETVNDWLTPRQVDDGKNGWHEKSRLHIFEDRCPELIYELKNNRREQLSAVQAEKIDPTGKPVQVRKHMTDNLLYICAANPVFVPPSVRHDSYAPPVKGISY